MLQYMKPVIVVLCLILLVISVSFVESQPTFNSDSNEKQTQTSSCSSRDAYILEAVRQMTLELGFRRNPSVTKTRCEIAAQSYSANDDNTRVDGYIELNGRRVWNAGWPDPNLRGVNTMIIDPFSCRKMDVRRFDTYESESNSGYLATYLRNVSDGAVIVGVTGDEPTQRLRPALMTLAAAGVHVGDVTERGNFVFVIQRGYPEKTVYRKSLTNANLTTLLSVTLEAPTTTSTGGSSSTTTLTDVITIPCEIAAQSYSATDDNTQSEGYIELNGRRVWNARYSTAYPNLRGLNTMIVDPFSCTEMDVRQFDTYESESNSEYLATYLQYVREGAVIVGVTGDEPTRRLRPALMTLSAAGVHVGDVKDRGNFVFVIQKGYPKKTVYKKSLTNANPTTRLNVTMEGCQITRPTTASTAVPGDSLTSTSADGINFHTTDSSSSNQITTTIIVVCVVIGCLLIVA